MKKNTAPKFSPSLHIFHAKKDNKGSMMKMSIIPATETTPGYALVALAPQKNETSFDNEKTNTFPLTFTAVSKMLQVFRGETEAINDGEGIVNRTAKIAFNMSHVLEPKQGYKIGILNYGREDVFITLTTAEALGLCVALEGSMRYLAFGNPEDGVSFEDLGDEGADETHEDGNSDSPAAEEEKTEVDKPTEDEIRTACKTLIDKIGMDYAYDVTCALKRLMEGNAITDEEYRTGVEILGENNPVVKYAASRM